MIHDFGRVRSGSIMKHEFTFTNTGNAGLIIDNVLPACGCTSIKEFTRVIPPSGKASLTLEFNSFSLQGEQIKTMLVKSNDPVQPNLVLQLKGVYWSPIEIYPLTALLFTAPHGSKALHHRAHRQSNGAIAQARGSRFQCAATQRPGH